MAATDGSERFPATGGRVTGIAILAMSAGVLVLAVAERDEPWSLSLGLAALTFAGIAWASMLRPALSVDGDRLVMRGMVGTVEVPLAAIEQVAVRQVLAVRAGEKRYVSPVVSKSRRRLTRAERVRGAERPVQGEVSYADFVEERILHLAEQARSERGVALLSDEQLALGRDVRRAWAWPVVAAVTVPLVLFVLSVLL
ncbi:hypothetical protein [uncultured Nocardioides sp.]|uniref:hypothetical protein n=1 Tax=uncultured Nocardioides sp. TaxID=198441 RepID=UPI0025D631B5|nr:hypothetical protein [uncultured Nocardioides sp.]